MDIIDELDMLQILHSEISYTTTIDADLLYILEEYNIIPPCESLDNLHIKHIRDGLLQRIDYLSTYIADHFTSLIKKLETGRDDDADTCYEPHYM